ncbi:hypothetical protein HL650_05770 [Blautia pseudococcoides]|nr:hypothetical protein HL650_05770 [Blautia pseudococcoides]
MIFNKVYHIHFRYVGDNDNEYPQIAKEYEKMKLQLGKSFEHNRDAYTNAKKDFVRKWTSEAKKTYL